MKKFLMSLFVMLCAVLGSSAEAVTILPVGYVPPKPEVVVPSTTIYATVLEVLPCNGDTARACAMVSHVVYSPVTKKLLKQSGIGGVAGGDFGARNVVQVQFSADSSPGDLLAAIETAVRKRYSTGNWDVGVVVIGFPWTDVSD